MFNFRPAFSAIVPVVPPPRGFGLFGTSRTIILPRLLRGGDWENLPFLRSCGLGSVRLGSIQGILWVTSLSGIGLSGCFEAHSPRDMHCTCNNVLRAALMRPPYRAALPKTSASNFGQCQPETSISTSNLLFYLVILTARCTYGIVYAEANAPATA